MRETNYVSLEDHRSVDFCSEKSFYSQMKLTENTESWSSSEAPVSSQKLMIRQESSVIAQLRAARTYSQEAKSP